MSEPLDYRSAGKLTEREMDSILKSKGWLVGHRVCVERDEPPTPVGCTGPCDQGRRMCPCPDACGIAVPSDSVRRWPQVAGLILLLLSASAAVAAAYIVGWHVLPALVAAWG